MKEIEMLNCDFDLFYLVNDKYPIHIATAGCIINTPPYAGYTVAEVISRSKKVCEDFPLSDSDQIEINPELSNILGIDVEFAKTVCDTVLHQQFEDPLTTYITKVYAWSFIRMAQRGFISLDRTHINMNDHLFHWVARPCTVENNDIRPLPSLEIAEFDVNLDTNRPFKIDI
jgi:hypothetical protein